MSLYLHLAAGREPFHICLVIRYDYVYNSADKTMSTQELEARVLHLSHRHRARLAKKLIDSLDEDDKIEREWAEEAKRRYEEIRSGSVDPVPAELVFSELRSELS